MPTRSSCSLRVLCIDADVLANADAPGQSVIENGPSVPGETSQRLACDASRVVMRHDADGRITEVGARTRTIPPALRRALLHCDRGCRFPGYWVPLGQGHHIRHWANGGPTALSNLVMLCRRHHRAVHEEGFQVERLPGDELRFNPRTSMLGWTGEPLNVPYAISVLHPLATARPDPVFSDGRLFTKRFAIISLIDSPQEL